MKKIIFIILISVVFKANAGQAFPFTVLHTNDLHSYFNGGGPDGLFTSEKGDGDPVNGHYARLTQAIKEERSKRNNPVLLLDAGDFFGGTLFHMVAPNEKYPYAPELEFFIYNDYDVATLGNHEFDPKDEGLALMLQKVSGRTKNFKIISSNLKFNSIEQKFWKPFYSDSVDGRPKTLISNRIVKELEYGGVKHRVGIIGALGPDGALVSRNNRRLTSLIGFDDKTMKVLASELHGHLQKEVDYLRQKLKVQTVILVTHAGTPEDIEMAENVNGIDLIISGHTHELYQTPKRVGKTLISQAGCYGNYLGILDLAHGQGDLKLQNDKAQTYRKIDDQTATDQGFLKKVEAYTKAAKEISTNGKFEFSEHIFTSYKNMKKERVTGNPLGKFVTSTIKKNLEEKEKIKVDLYFTSISTVRTPIIGSDTGVAYQFSDIFKMLAIGLDDDGEAGTPIVHFYLSKWEVKLLINFMEIYSLSSKNFAPTFSDDISYSVRKWGIPMLNRLKDLRWQGKEYGDWPEYMRVATNDMVASYVDKVGPMSYGLVNFVAKDKNGKPLPKVLKTKQKEYLLFTDAMKRQKSLR